MHIPSAHPYKILLYSHDTFGLGNIRRTLSLAAKLTEQYPHAAILIATGSPVVHSFRIPERVDYVKLPSLDRVAAERYAPRFLHHWASEVREMRTALLSRIVAGFEPDLFIVDKRPSGIDGELLGTLTALRQRGAPTRLVVGIRDILDAPARTRRALRDSQFCETVDRFYDEVWIYGTREVFDPVREYGFTPGVAAKVRFTGYLGRTAPACDETGGSPRVVVTTGGGGDGSPMIAAYLEGLSGVARGIALRSTVILGPEMPAERRRDLLERYGHLADVELLDFDPDPLSRLASADIVVAMAGYNTVCEVMSSGRPAILVPRGTPVLEQLIRARRFARMGCVDMVEPAQLTPARLIRKVLDCLSRPQRPRATVDLCGLSRVGERTAALLEGLAA